MIPPPPWMYSPLTWDTEDLREEFEKNPPSTTIPSQMDVIVLEGDEATPPTPLIATSDSLKLGPQQTFPYSQIRYVTTNCRAFAKDSDPYVILVSLRMERGFGIANMFIKARNAADTLSTLNFLQYHVFQYLRLSLAQEDPSVVQQYMRPLLAHKFQVQVHRRQSGETWEEERILLLDKECVSLYKPRFYQAEPTDPPMFFWREKDVKSVYKVSRIKSANCILFQSQELYIVVPYNQEMASDLEAEIVNSVGNGDTPKKAFGDPRVLLQWLREDYHEELEEVIMEDFEPVEIDPEQNEKMGKLERELQEGMKEFLGSQSETMWDNYEPELKNLLRAGALPPASEKRRDFDPNNADHLLDMIKKIEELLFVDVDYQRALAEALSMKRLFLESRVLRIRALMEREDALSLLKKLCARGNVSTRKQPTSTRQAADEDDDDMTGGFDEDDDQ